MATSVRTVVIPNPQGLHARPIALIAETAGRFSATLLISVDGLEVDGRSILQLMTLCASMGTELTLSSQGDDADELVAAIAAVVESGFGEM